VLELVPPPEVGPLPEASPLEAPGLHLLVTFDEIRRVEVASVIGFGPRLLRAPVASTSSLSCRPLCVNDVPFCLGKSRNPH
jgi:hypothetical protein